MSEFKKFCKSYKHPELGCMLKADCESCKAIWIAALRWVLSLHRTTDRGPGCGFCAEYVDVEDVQQELEALKND